MQVQAGARAVDTNGSDRILENDSSIDFLGGRKWVRQPHTASTAAEKRADSRVLAYVDI